MVSLSEQQSSASLGDSRSACDCLPGGRLQNLCAGILFMAELAHADASRTNWRGGDGSITLEVSDEDRHKELRSIPFQNSQQ